MYYQCLFIFHLCFDLIFYFFNLIQVNYNINLIDSDYNFVVNIIVKVTAITITMADILILQIIISLLLAINKVNLL